EREVSESAYPEQGTPLNLLLTSHLTGQARNTEQQTPENQTHNNRVLAFLPPKSPFVPDLQGLSRQKEGEDREKVGR
ncbi:MAG: hypothetical protein K9I29_09490, partial [Bacteroidales bacterium]|nr:hypothetical protein [Bacteroidales bacterium]